MSPKYHAVNCFNLVNNEQRVSEILIVTVRHVKKSKIPKWNNLLSLAMFFLLHSSGCVIMIKAGQKQERLKCFRIRRQLLDQNLSNFAFTLMSCIPYSCLGLYFEILQVCVCTRVCAYECVFQARRTREFRDSWDSFACVSQVVRLYGASQPVSCAHPLWKTPIWTQLPTWTQCVCVHVCWKKRKFFFFSLSLSVQGQGVFMQSHVHMPCSSTGVELMARASTSC